jgi:hypothetical protein
MRPRAGGGRRLISAATAAATTKCITKSSPSASSSGRTRRINWTRASAPGRPRERRQFAASRPERLVIRALAQITAKTALARTLDPPAALAAEIDPPPPPPAGHTTPTGSPGSGPGAQTHNTNAATTNKPRAARQHSLACEPELGADRLDMLMSWNDDSVPAEMSRPASQRSAVRCARPSPPLRAGRQPEWAARLARRADKVVVGPLEGGAQRRGRRTQAAGAGRPPVPPVGSLSSGAGAKWRSSGGRSGRFRANLNLIRALNQIACQKQIDTMTAAPARTTHK